VTKARHTTVSDETARMDFAKNAAAHFAANPKHSSFGEIAPGELIALRWGLGDDCVLVLRIDAFEEAVIFAQIIKRPVVEDLVPKPSLKEERPK
jgi:hypothetical protein